MSAPELVLSRIPVKAIAEHPKNPRRELKHIDELAASMQTNGLLQPVVVVPMAAFVEAYRDAAEGWIQAADGLEYVSVIGHRRTAAAELLEWETIDAIIRPDLASAQAASRTFIVENLQRINLDPIEEARGYADLVALRMSQREIALTCGKSQPHVSKRLALLQLPEDAQEQASEGRVKLADAVKLAGLPADARERAWRMYAEEPFDPDLGECVAEIEREIEAARKRAEFEQQAADEGVELIDPIAMFGRNRYDHTLYDAKAIAKARKAGTLRAEATARGLSYFSTIPRESTTTSADASGDTAARKQASKNRRPALMQLVAKPPAADQLAAELAAAIVHGDVGHFEALKLLKSWLPAGVSPGAADVYSWRDGIGQEKWAWLAWAMTVASTEMTARSSYTNWGPRQAAHVQRLIDEAGYEPTDWEAAQLARVEQQAADKAARAELKAS
ncbi:ParB/RepB/Spo0J family partition protein [Kribbella sp. NPDC056345]|uniref:ParB/RepB/Spo0J family partition protein n=1 Tax=Kribbella sp. NPDC056345 TaxID=3345789 RepID=UPI0035DC7E52